MSIPKIIHQIWIQGYDYIPKHLKEYHLECKKINKDFKFIVWDDKSIREYIKANFKKKYLDLYDSYKIPAQKADFARYAILYNYGGIYLDMDMICKKNLSKFLDNGVFFTTHKDLMYNLYKRYLNGIVGAVPKHPLFRIILKNIIIRRNFTHNVSYSTGTRLLFDCVNYYEQIYKKNDVKLIDSKYLHPCTIFSDEKKCISRCKDCYIGHTSNSSWSPTLKAFNFVKHNFKLISLLLLILIIGVMVEIYMRRNT